MIKIVTQTNLADLSPALREMFRARAQIFRDRLGWDVRVNEAGLEIDRYDLHEEPIYLLAYDGELVTGSLRLLPTTGETMLRNEFAAMFDEPVDFMSATAWECTRFCVHPRAVGASASAFQSTSSELLKGLCDLALRSGIEQIVGLYDNRMTRIYRRIGWSPAPLASTEIGGQQLIVGIWDVSETALQTMIAKTADSAFSSQAA